jgi:hypothetical protein
MQNPARQPFFADTHHSLQVTVYTGLLLMFTSVQCQVDDCSSSRKVSGLTPTEVFALATPKGPVH